MDICEKGGIDYIGVDCYSPDIMKTLKEQIKWIETNLNNRPRKRLEYLTPNEKFK